MGFVYGSVGRLLVTTDEGKKNAKAPATCTQTVIMVANEPGVASLQYSPKGGNLIWYDDRFNLKEMSLDKSIDCSAIREQLEESLEKWCPIGKNCAKTYPKSIMLMEGEKRWPWDVVVYRKSLPTMIKTTICTKPTQPTTRRSPENCCVITQLPEGEVKEPSRNSLIFS